MNETGSQNRWAWGLCVILLLATLLNYMDRQALSVLLPTLKLKFHLVEGRVGWLEGCFGISFALGSIFFGLLADRWGPRVLYPVILMGWSLAGIATSFADQPWIQTWFQGVNETEGTGVFRWLLICRVLLGFCEAGHWPCALLTVRSVLTARDRTLGNGILQSGASLGAILVPLYIEATERAGYDWAFPFWSIGIAGIIWVPLWFITVSRALPQSPTIQGLNEDVQEPLQERFDGDWFRRVIVLALIVATLTISWQFLRAWLGLFLQDHHHYTKQATRTMMSGYFVAADIGCLLAGLFVSSLARRGWGVHDARKLGFTLFTLLTACGALIPFVPKSALMIGLLYVTGAGILGLHPYYYALTQEISAKRLGFFSGALAAFGWIISSLSQIYLGKHIEATKSYELGLVMVGLAPVIGLIALWVIWPRKVIE